MHVRSVQSEPEWKNIDSMIVRLAASKGELDYEIGRWLLRAKRANVHRYFGCASFADYVLRRFGHKARTTKEKVRVAEAVEKLPRLKSTLKDGSRSWSAVREITRVATPETEAEWVAKTEGKTLRQIEVMVSRAVEPGDPLLAIHRLVVNMSPALRAMFEAAAEHARREIGAGATNEEVFLALCQKELGKRDPTKPGYQGIMGRCVDCDRAWMAANGQLFEVPAAVGACAGCDCEVIGATQLEEEAPLEPEPALQVVEDAGAHVGTSYDDKVAIVAGLRKYVRQGGAPAMLRVVSQILGGPYETIPPALRAAVFARDKYRCKVPGCNNHIHIHVHHLIFQRKSGPNSMDNLVCLCTQHHVLLHDGYLSIVGTPSTGMTFRGAKGEMFG